MRPAPRHFITAHASRASPSELAVFQIGTRSGNTGRPGPTPEPSTRGVVDITQDVRLKLQILQTVLDYITDTDDAS